MKGSSITFLGFRRRGFFVFSIFFSRHPITPSHTTQPNTRRPSHPSPPHPVYTTTPDHRARPIVFQGRRDRQNSSSSGKFGSSVPPPPPPLNPPPAAAMAPRWLLGSGPHSGWWRGGRLSRPRRAMAGSARAVWGWRSDEWMDESIDAVFVRPVLFTTQQQKTPPSSPLPSYNHKPHSPPLQKHTGVERIDIVGQARELVPVVQHIGPRVLDEGRPREEVPPLLLPLLDVPLCGMFVGSLGPLSVQ